MYTVGQSRFSTMFCMQEGETCVPNKPSAVYKLHLEKLYTERRSVVIRSVDRCSLVSGDPNVTYIPTFSSGSGAQRLQLQFG